MGAPLFQSLRAGETMRRPKKSKARDLASRQQPRSQVTRQSILQAAVHEFARYGLPGARVDTIAARAGLNKQLLYYHFGNKEDLFRASLAFIYGRPFPKEMLSIAHGPGRAKDKMRMLISSLFEHFRSMEDGTAVIAHENQYRGKHLNAGLRKTIHASISPIIEAIRVVLAQGQRDGVFRNEISVEHLYLTLVAMSMFYFNHAYTLSAILETDLLADAAVRSWQVTVETVTLSTIERRGSQPRNGKPARAYKRLPAKPVSDSRRAVRATSY